MKKTMKEIWNSQAMKKFVHNKKAMLGLAIVMILVLAVVFIPLFADLDPYTTDRAAGFNKPPSDAHILGTDVSYRITCNNGNQRTLRNP